MSVKSGKITFEGKTYRVSKENRVGAELGHQSDGVYSGNNTFSGGIFYNNLVTLTADTTLTQAAHAGRTILLGEVGGDASLTATLPAASGTGDIYKFVVSVVNTSNYVIQVANANDTIDGLVHLGLDDGASKQFLTAAASDTITINATTKGGLRIGDTIIIQDIASNQFTVTGLLAASGTIVTPFSAAVS